MSIFAYIGEKPIYSNHAGNKARLDIDRILEDNYGSCLLNIDQVTYRNILEKLQWILNINNIALMLKLASLQQKNLVIQYPYYFNPIIKYLLNKLSKDNREILIVHDVDSLRSLSKQTLGEDIADMNKAEVVILHNSKMIAVLKEKGLSVPAVNLELFDYLLQGNLPKQDYQLGKTLAFAGNLGKSDFLKDNRLNDLQVKFNLYGPNFDENEICWNNIEYKGSFKPNEIPYKIEGSFGLIWDGEVVDTCSGAFGHYMKYNNPHKLSLYIAAGLPVVVWEEAAIADFVNKYDIGITVKSLLDVEDKINLVTEAQYENFKKNLLVLQKNVAHGYYTKRALSECEKIFSKKSLKNVKK